MVSKPVFKRVVLKFSGEVLGGEKHNGIDRNVAEYLVDEIKSVKELGVQIGLVIGGGNFIRGVSSADSGLSRITADYMGMIATVMNALALRDFFRNAGVDAVVSSAIYMQDVAETVDIEKLEKELKAGKVLIFAGGTGRPFVSTDTAAALRACEFSADVIIKGTKVEGLFDKDPEKYEDAKFIADITYTEVLNRGLNVMDLTAFAMCQANRIPVIIYNMNKKGYLKRIVLGEKLGSIIHGK